MNPASATSTDARAAAAAWRAWRGLVRVLAGPGPAPVWRWRSDTERRAALITLAMATLVFCLLSAGNMHGVADLHGTRPPSTNQWPPVPLQRLLGVLVVAPLPLAAWYPMLAWRIGWLALLLSPLVPAAWWGGWPWSPPQVLALLAAFCLAGIRQQRAELWLMWALTLIPWVFWLVKDIPHLNGPASATIIFTAAAIVTDNFGSRLRAQTALAAQTERAETERSRRAILEERGRIARELHDVVAHHMSLIAVQAETAPYRLPGLPEQAQAEFASLSGTAREALADMRRLLGVLRHEGPAALAPQPQLTDLPALVDATRKAGVPVELSVAPAVTRVPPGVGVCAYRIVQESLSNASQHAPGAAVTVSVGQESHAVLLQVANGPGRPDRPGRPGVPATPRRENGPGHGLTGMRERVALLGGSLSAGPAPDGGFVVTVLLPLGETG